MIQNLCRRRFDLHLVMHDFLSQDELHTALLIQRLKLASPYEKAYACHMQTMNASEAREKLYRLLDDTASDHEPVLITGPRSNAILIGESYWNAIQETLYLLTVPGMYESIIEGLATPLNKCEAELHG